METKEHQVFKNLEHWRPIKTITSPEDLFDQNSSLFPLFQNFYQKIEKISLQLSKRKNGENPFLHPLNVVLNLKKAGITDKITLCVALIHDLIEEKVDLYRIEQNIHFNDESKKIMDNYEQEVWREFEQELFSLCQKDNLKQDCCQKIIDTLKLLTRHKRHFYYTSITGIFNCSDPKLKARAIQIKLADRIHNILTIEEFDEHGRLYQCFKNIFILNNVKKHLQTNSSPFTQKLFKNCCKATYDAFLTICHLYAQKNIAEVRPMLQLALKKYAFEVSGLWEVTVVDEKETHPLRLFQGVVRKYDARLHQEWEKYDLLVEKEKDYCKKFFVDYNFADEQITAIIDYKDAFSLKEVVACLLYLPDYVIARFLCSDLSSQGRIQH